MMKYSIRNMAGLLILVTMAAGSVTAEPTDGDAIRQAVLNYVDSIYLMKPELIDESVHARLQKVGFAPDKDGTGYREMWMTRDELRELTVHWNKDGHMNPETAKREVKILDQLDQTAVVRLDAEWGVDFIQLAKMKGTWLIINVMWQTYAKE